MKHKVKVIKAEDGILTLRVDGEKCSYLIERAAPLGPMDAKMLRGALDTSFLESIMNSVTKPGRSYLPRFFTFWRQSDKPTLSAYATLRYCESVADYIERVGVEVHLEPRVAGGPKAVVILKSDVAKIRKGGEL